MSVTGVGDKRFCDGFAYIKKSIVKNKRYWRCNLRDTEACGATLIENLANGKFTKGRSAHTHQPNPISVQASQAMQFAKELVVSDPCKRTGAILKEVQQKFSAAATLTLAIPPHMKRNIARWKRNNFADYAEPGEKELTFDIPDEFKTVSIDQKNVPFLLHDTGKEDEERILIFSTKDSIAALSLCNTILVDGTFKSSPSQFLQIFSLHGVMESEHTDMLTKEVKKIKLIVPLVYSLLPNKTESTYTRALNAMCSFGYMLSPTYVVCDFELAIINALHTAFPTAKVQGCLFHFRQNIYKQIQKHPVILEKYSNDPDFYLVAKMFQAIAFVPPAQTLLCLDDIRREYPQYFPLLNPIAAYLEKNYIGRYEDPTYPSELWSVYSRVLDDIPRTTNAVEGWHSGLNYRIDKPHPSIWIFFAHLKHEYKNTSTMLHYFNYGLVPCRKRKYQVLDDKIFNQVKNYYNKSRIDFLRALAHLYLKKQSNH